MSKFLVAFVCYHSVEIEAESEEVAVERALTQSAQELSACCYETQVEEVLEQ